MPNPLYDSSNSRLWKRAFSGPDLVEYRGLLQRSLEEMKEKAFALVDEIATACPGLTVHDRTHLEALWEMADLLCGDSLLLNPVETYALGGAILLHDASMSLAAFRVGDLKLQDTTEWKDREQAYARNHPSLRGVPFDKWPKNHGDALTFSVLRKLHAQQAEALAAEPWRSPDGTATFLVGDESLRRSYGREIGRIAHSHHWDIERIAAELPARKGANTKLPIEWTLDARKVAYVLRAADAAHLDRRRAPPFLLKLREIEGDSLAHWEAQTRIDKPTQVGDSLQFTSGEEYSPDNAAGWWCAYDLVQNVDKELRDANAALTELGIGQMSVKGVMGASSPSNLAKYLPTSGWTPIDARVRVSDAEMVATKLGGARLYGPGVRAPLRELIQNAIDAVRARRAIERRPLTWGTISISFEDGPDERVWVHVDDPGVGMSQRVMCGPLVDFGRSFWNSSDSMDEFPGLSSKDVSYIGRYGIGFFSVFSVSSEVRVISRRFDAGAHEINELRFVDGLTARPILLRAKQGSLPTDVSTRVSLLVRKGALSTSQSDDDEWSDFGRRRPPSLEAWLTRLIAPLNIEVKLVDTRVPRQFDDRVHAPFFGEKQQYRSLFTELYAERDLSTQRIERIADAAQSVVLEDGTDAGVLSLGMQDETDIAIESGFFYDMSTPDHLMLFGEVGGLAVASVGDHALLGVSGILSGNPLTIDRNTVAVDSLRSKAATWAKSYTLARRDEWSEDPCRRLVSAIRLSVLGARKHEVLFRRGGLVSVARIQEFASRVQEIWLPARSTRHTASSLYFANYLMCDHRLLTRELHDNVVVLAFEPGRSPSPFDGDAMNEALARLRSDPDQDVDLDDLAAKVEHHYGMVGAAMGWSLVDLALAEAWGGSPNWCLGRRTVFAGSDGKSLVLVAKRPELPPAERTG